MTFLILAVPVALAVVASVHGLKVRRANLRAFEAHSERLRGIR